MIPKKKTRREFLEFGLKVGVAFPLITSTLYSCISKEAQKKLKILILGGTSFLGPHQIAYALNRGHSISIFTRGKTKPSIYTDLFDKVEQLVGDRNDDLTALENRSWDVVIDNSGRQAAWTKRSAELLKDNCGLYVYTSSTGVYYPYINSDFKESSSVLLKVPENIPEEEKLEYNYGTMKANSELEAMHQFGADRTIIVRPTYMMGPADRTDRFIHWPLRLSKGGETMIPGKEEDAVQYIDVRDVAEWMIRLAEENANGIYNAVGPKEPQNIYSFVEEAKKAFDVEHSFVKIDDYDFLEEQQVYFIVPWIMPYPNSDGSAKINNRKALENGLSFRPLTATMKDTLDWWKSPAVSQERRDAYASNSIIKREKAIIEKWKSR